MTGPHHRRFKASLAAAIAAIACWIGLPGTVVDKTFFGVVARGFANPPFFITGHGKHDSPWKLRTFDASEKSDPRYAPVVISLDDDLEGFFQSSPPSPIDLAVIFSNLQRLGVTKASTGAVLAWGAPDPIGLAALDKVLSRFDSLVMAAPLSRGAVPEPLPQAFRNASLALSAVHGNTTMLPAVNRIPLPGVILGGRNTMAGFQSLESEKSTTLTPMLARWEDRLVFSFAVLAVLRHLDLPLEGIECRPGEFLKLSPHGPTVPIDKYGRLALPLKSLPALTNIRAETLIDGTPDLLPSTNKKPIVLRDDRSAAEPSTRAFSRSLPAMIAAISSDAGLSKTNAYLRASVVWEIFILLLAVLTPIACGSVAPFARNIIYLLVVGSVVSIQVIAAGSAHLWLPGLPCIAALAAGWMISNPWENPPIASVPTANTEKLPETTVEHALSNEPVAKSETTMTPVAASVGKPAPPKKTVTRKSTPRKNTPKKTATKEADIPKKPPSETGSKRKKRNS